MRLTKILTVLPALFSIKGVYAARPAYYLSPFNSTITDVENELRRGQSVELYVSWEGSPLKGESLACAKSIIERYMPPTLEASSLMRSLRSPRIFSFTPYNLERSYFVGPAEQRSQDSLMPSNGFELVPSGLEAPSLGVSATNFLNRYNYFERMIRSLYHTPIVHARPSENYLDSLRDIGRELIRYFDVSPHLPDSLLSHRVRRAHRVWNIPGTVALKYQDKTTQRAIISNLNTSFYFLPCLEKNEKLRSFFVHAEHPLKAAFKCQLTGKSSFDVLPLSYLLGLGLDLRRKYQDQAFSIVDHALNDNDLRLEAVYQRFHSSSFMYRWLKRFDDSIKTVREKVFRDLYKHGAKITRPASVVNASSPYIARLFYENQIKKDNCKNVPVSFLQKADESGVTPLQKAAAAGNYRGFSTIIEKTELTLDDFKDSDLLVWAHIGGNEDIINILKPYYSENLSDLELDKLIAELNFDVNIKDRLAQTPLHHAIKKLNVEAVKGLLKAGANPNILDVYGETPLLYLVKKIARIESKLCKYPAATKEEFRAIQKQTIDGFANDKMNICTTILFELSAHKETDVKIKDITGFSADKYLYADDLKTKAAEN